MNAIRPELIRMLSELNPNSPYGTEIFNALARVTISVAIEAVCLWNSEDGIKIYLTKRHPVEDYANQWHSPGSVMRPGEGFYNVFKRLEEKEFGFSLPSGHFAGNFNNKREARGHFFTVIYVFYLNEKSTIHGKGQWFPVDHLPENMVIHQKEHMIPIALQYNSKPVHY